MSVLRLTPEQYAAAQKRAAGRSSPLAGVKAPSKYRNRATGGYASVKEARRAEQLKVMQKMGAIRNLREQVPFVLIPAQRNPLEPHEVVERACHYVADFVYDEDLKPPCGAKHWATVVEDCKGMRTPEYIIKRKLMLHVHGIRVRET